MKKFISPQQIKTIKNYKNVRGQHCGKINESSNMDANHKCIHIIENWKSVNINPDSALLEVLTKIEDMYNTQSSIIQSGIIDSINKNIMPYVSDNTLNNILIQNQSKIVFDLSESVDVYLYYNKLEHNYNKLDNRCNFSKLLENSKVIINNKNLSIEQKKNKLFSIIETSYNSYKEVPTKALYYIISE